MSATLHTDRSLAYLRTGKDARAQRLLVLCHGVGGNETNLLSLAANAPHDTAAVLVRGPLTLGPSQYGWFQVAFGPDGPRPNLDEAERSRRQLTAFVADLQADMGMDAARTVIAGFSQGGIISASVALTRPDLVAGFGVLAGRILPELEPQLADRAALANLRGFIGHGRDDTKLPVEWARRADAWLTRLGIPHDMHLYPGDHGIPSNMATDFLAWSDAVSPAPEPALLWLGGEDTRIVGGAAGELGRRLAPGVDRLRREYFNVHASMALAMENAIAAIEDDLATVSRELHAITLSSSDPLVGDIAGAAGLGAEAESITRDAVEHVFTRLSRVTSGRPAVSEGLPEDPAFAPGLLLVRELMHHLDIDRLHLGVHGRNAIHAATAPPSPGALP